MVKALRSGTELSRIRLESVRGGTKGPKSGRLRLRARHGRASVCATERNFELTTGNVTLTRTFNGTVMTIDSTILPATKRISGTLHKRGYVPPSLVEDENLRRGRAEESEVAGRNENSGQLTRGVRSMKPQELNGRYQHLRTELDAAYAAPVWDSNCINRITEEMAPVELALASCEGGRSNETGDSYV